MVMMSLWNGETTVSDDNNNAVDVAYVATGGSL
jgi:hypothetical protein